MSPSSSSSSSHPPSSSYQPPRLPYRANSESSSSSSPISLTTPNGYPNEKLVTMPHQLIQSPNAHIVESPTAPQAVSLGLGPASPGYTKQAAFVAFELRTFCILACVDLTKPGIPATGIHATYHLHTASREHEHEHEPTQLRLVNILLIFLRRLILGSAEIATVRSSAATRASYSSRTAGYGGPGNNAKELKHLQLRIADYRHGSVKYTLTALVTTKGFLGGVQELKVNKVVELKDLINCAQEPFSNSTVVTGSSNTKPATNKPKNLAMATITLAKSAYLKGQAISINIDMSHPNTIQRSPGCWIQLIRMENYHSGEQSKEYSHVVASSTHAIEMDLKHGKILTELTVPEDAIATMSTTKIISIEYKLQFLFDMRPRTGFLEGRNRRTVNKKLRAKITGKPGGFDVEVPVVIGTLFDSSHVPGSGTVSSLAISLPGVQPPEIPSPGNSIRTLEHL
ncbi:hypothetical protein BGZ82_003733, partial [Podila clonocystis]